MLTPIILLLGLAVATCIIAYVADNLGKKLGKKRVTLWGLRPRQTATLLTMASGLGIMLVTLFVLLALWGPLRHALLSYDRVRADSQELNARNAELQRNLNKLGLQSRKLQSQATRSRQQAADARQQSVQAQQQFVQANQQLHGAQQNLAAAQKARGVAVLAEAEAQRGESAARQRAESAQQRFAQAQNRLANSRQRLSRVEDFLESARKGLDRTRGHLTAARKNLVHAKVQLATAKGSLTTTQGIVKSTMGTVRNLTQDVAQRAAEVARLQEGEQEQQRKVADLQTRRDQLQQEIATLTQETVRLTAVAQQFASAAEQLATGQVIIPVSQVFAERRLPPRPGAADARAALNELLAEGRKAVSNFEAKDIVLAPISIESGSRLTSLDQEQILALLVKHLVTFETPVAVRLLAVRNHFAGEKEILGRMEVLPVRAAFNRGELVASTTVDGKQSDARIFNQLLTLINEGEKVAREHKVAPPLTPDNPHFYGPGTNERIFEALRQIQAINGPANVRLIAVEEISTVEPMHVRIEVAAS